MVSQCVIDVDLFKKYSLDNNRCKDCPKNPDCSNGYALIADCLFDKGDKDSNKQCDCLAKFLELVSIGKCIIYYDEDIINEYSSLENELPLDLSDEIFDILSNTEHAKKIEGSIKENEFNQIETTDLKRKKIYLSVAKSLHHKRIISTKEDKIKIYDSNKKFLINHLISCKNVCEQWNELWKEIKTELKKVESNKE